MTERDEAKRIARIQSKVNAKATGRKPIPFPAPNGITEFVTSPRFLNRPRLYPRQATLLKIFACEVEMLTAYDLEVIAEWEAGFTLVHREGSWVFEGKRGLAPGTVARMHACRESGRQWLREFVLVMGRRGGKGYLSALMIAYVAWRVLALEDPQEFFDIESTKQLVFMTMAADKVQAKDNLYRDVSKLIETAPCFQPFIDKKMENSIRLCTPADIAADREGSLLIEPRATTASSGRGSATIVFAFDEMAWAPADGQARGADEVYRGATPSMTQFGGHAATILASSPASETGEFNIGYRRALDAIDANGIAADPTVMMVQLPSWGAYEGWELTNEGLEMWPNGPDFQALAGPVIGEFFPDVVRARRYRYEDYLVEYEAQWRSSVYAYINGYAVEAIFDHFDGAPLQFQHVPQSGFAYAMHSDPGTVGSRFAIMIAHRIGDRQTGHIVVDVITVYDPVDSETGHVNYLAVQEAIWSYLQRFRPFISTFDQHNSELMIQTLSDRVQQFGLSGQVVVTGRPATAKRNLADAELAKRLILEGRVHCPPFKLLHDELRFLERRGDKIDAPTSGEIQTSDTVDCLFTVIAHLMDGGEEIIDRLRNTPLTTASLRGLPRPAAFEQFSRDRRGGGGWVNPARGARFRR